MRRSTPITDAGRLIAVAAETDRDWFLIAIDPRLDELDRAHFPSVAEAERVARGYLRRNHPVLAMGSC